MMNLPTLTTAYVSQLIDFSAESGGDKESGFARSQLEGTVALFNMLATNKIAYLADEVGMGKTYIALGVISLLRHVNPHARVVVITPRENIQHKWIKERSNFVRNNWLIRGHRVKSIQGGPAWDAVPCGSLIDFVHESALEANRDFFLRMSSFSLASRSVENRESYIKRLKQQLPWLTARHRLSSRNYDDFVADVGGAMNEVIADADLLIFDEAHNLKHGFRRNASIRNRLMGYVFSHPQGDAEKFPNYQQRAKRVLFLSATPFEDDYAAIHRQFEVFGYDNHPIKSLGKKKVGTLDQLSSNKLSVEQKADIVSAVMVRRVASLNIAGKRYTKNMYRRDWREGGVQEHDMPISVDDPIQQLVIALMQKKVSEVLQHERFNNSFQMGMLSSFESFTESVSRKSIGGDVDEDDNDNASSITMSDELRQKQLQGGLDRSIRQGVDTQAIEQVTKTYRQQFGRALPHPKLDVTADNLGMAFATGDKTLVFVRRVATVHELAAKVDAIFDRWIEQRFRDALPKLGSQLDELFMYYQLDRERRPNEPELPKEVDVALADTLCNTELEPEDQKGVDTFFSWFFRGEGIEHFQSGSNYRRSRFSRNASLANFFKDNQGAFILGYPNDVQAALLKELESDAGKLRRAVNSRANRILQWQLEKRDSKSDAVQRVDRHQRFEAAQFAALDILSQSKSDVAASAAQVADLQYGHLREGLNHKPESPGTISADEFVAEKTLYSVMAQDFSELLSDLLPGYAFLSNCAQDRDFEQWYTVREQRRELITAVARLGVAYIDLYLCAIGDVDSIKLGDADKGSLTSADLAAQYCQRLMTQRSEPGFHAWHELHSVAESHWFVMSNNFPEVHEKSLSELPRYYTLTLQNQSPVGRMEGGVSKQLVKQFRMPGFPLVLVATDVLQEGEDLHTFCKNIVHYGIAWTPSAIEQRIGRVDRIGGLVQRHIDGRDTEPSPEQFLQIYYPHLQGTVEVLQVRRVLRKLYQFIALVHSNVNNIGDTESSIDVAKEISQLSRELPVLDHELESAFPGNKWLDGKLKKRIKNLKEVELIIKFFQKLVDKLAKSKKIRWSPINRDYYYAGDITIDGETHHFTLELRSQVKGDDVLLRCECTVAEIYSTEAYSSLLKYQQKAGLVKLCLVPLPGNRSEIRVREGIIFHPKYTQWEEVEGLITRTLAHSAKARTKWAASYA